MQVLFFFLGTEETPEHAGLCRQFDPNTMDQQHRLLQASAHSLSPY